MNNMLTAHLIIRFIIFTFIIRLVNRPPIIKFRNPVVQIDWSKTYTSPISIIVDIWDNDNADLISITPLISLATNYTIKNMPNSPVLNATIQIDYFPIINEYPVFSFIAVDSSGAAFINTVKVQICNCKSVDADNQCVYDTVQYAMNANVNIVRCSCSPYYIGII